jgi:hypothetical protein
VLDRVEEPSGFLVVQQDPRALRQDLFGALARSTSEELAERDAERRGSGLFERVLLVGDADLDAARFR